MYSAIDLIAPHLDCRYEEGHGLVDAVQFQKKLKNDLHRLETELEQRSLKVCRDRKRQC